MERDYAASWIKTLNQQIDSSLYSTKPNTMQRGSRVVATDVHPDWLHWCRDPDFQKDRRQIDCWMLLSTAYFIPWTGLNSSFLV